MSVTLSGVTPGHLIVVSTVNEASPTFAGAPADGSNTYNLLLGLATGSPTRIYMAVPTVGGNLTITSPTSIFGVICAAEFNPGGGTISVDGSGATANGTSATSSTGAFTVSGNNLVVGTVADSSAATPTFSGGYLTAAGVPLLGGSNIAGWLAYSLATASPATVSAALGSSMEWTAVGIGFVSTGGEATPVVPYRHLFGGMNFSLMDTP